MTTEQIKTLDFTNEEWVEAFRLYREAEKAEGESMQSENLKRRVAHGAKCLDRMVPGWHLRIDIPTLDLTDCTACVIGQLTGDYHTVRVTVDWSELDDSFALMSGAGFNYAPGLSTSLSTSQSRRIAYAQLTRAWIREIESRRTATLRLEADRRVATEVCGGNGDMARVAEALADFHRKLERVIVTAGVLNQFEWDDCPQAWEGIYPQELPSFDEVYWVLSEWNAKVKDRMLEAEAARTGCGALSGEYTFLDLRSEVAADQVLGTADPCSGPPFNTCPRCNGEGVDPKSSMDELCPECGGEGVV